MIREDFSSFLRLHESYDFVERPFYVGGKEAHLYYVDGFLNAGIFERVLQDLQKVKPQQLEGIDTLQEFSNRLVPYGECYIVQEVDKALFMMLSGPVAIFVEGLPGALMLDLRVYPTRGITEPENDKVLRGPRDGFCETINFNTGMVRRRIRDTRLVFKAFAVGETSKTDVVLGYMEGLADPELVKKLSDKINAIKTKSMIINQQNLVELLMPKKSLNPFPKTKSSERPDVAAHNLAEGRVVLFVDNCPCCLILPTFLADFTQQADDYYFSPSVGWYMKFIRLSTCVVTLFVTPLWLWLTSYSGPLPHWLAFVRVTEDTALPIYVQLMLMELAIDGLRLASLNTPSPLASSMSIVGGLILGDFAVSAGIVVPQTVFYMSFVSIATFSQPSLELGYSIKLCRIYLLTAAALFGIWGIFGAFVGLIILLTKTCTICGNPYFYPFIPFHAKDLVAVFKRSFSKNQS